MELRYEFVVPYPPEAVESVLLSPAFAVEAERSRRDTVISSQVVLESESESETRFRIISDEYDRNRLGQIDRSRRILGVTHCHWTTTSETLQWRYEGGHDGFVSVSGATRLQPHPEGTLVHALVTLKVTMPVVGRLIAKAVAGLFRKGFEGEEFAMRQQLFAQQAPAAARA